MITPAMRLQFTNGTYTWPIVLCEVWRTCRRGRNPSWTLCRARENAPDMTACEAIMAANVARTTMG